MSTTLAGMPLANMLAATARAVVLVKQFRHGIQRTLLELPGGTMDPEDVSPLAAIKRELLEETGFTSETFAEAATDANRLGMVSKTPRSIRWRAATIDNSN